MNVDKLKWTIIIIFIIFIALAILAVLSWNNRRSSDGTGNHFDRAYELVQGTTAEARVFGRSDESILSDKYRPLASLFESASGLKPSVHNDIEIITEGKRKYDLLIEDIQNAKESIHMEYFHFGIDKGSRAIREALIAKAKQGVKVRFIYDNIANIPIPPVYFWSMRFAGVEVRRYTGLHRIIPDLNYRDHRKVVVIDGKIAYTGGMNINDHYFKDWRDTHLRLTGDAVYSLQYNFLNMWMHSGGTVTEDIAGLFPEHDVTEELPVQIVPDGPDAPFPVIQTGLEWIAENAEDYLYIQTPYLVPSDSTLEAMKTATGNGVDVRIMIPQNSDMATMGYINRSFYKECLQLGIRIFERAGEFMHSKTMVCDDYLSSAGSANIDPRSLDLCYELNAYMYDRPTALKNKEIFLNDLSLCKEITEEVLKGYDFIEKGLQRFFRLFAPLV